MKKLLIVTMCLFNSEEPISRLKDSCAFLGLDLAHYGIGLKDQGFKINKVIDLAEFLKTKLEEYEYALFTDGFDAFMLEPEEVILARFAEFKSKIVISGERVCYPHKEAAGDFPEAPTSFKYLNSGGYMGKISDLIEGLETLVPHIPTSIYGGDQAMWMEGFLNKEVDVKIDYYNRLFLTMGNCDLNELDYHDGKFYFTETGANPCQIHFNGAKGDSPNGLNMEKFYQLYLQRRGECRGNELP